MRCAVLENEWSGPYLRPLLALCTIALLLGCSSVPPSPKISPPTKEFSDRLARAHFEGLAGIGPRLPGDDSDAAAREYLAREFQAVGARIQPLDVDGRQHLLVEIPGSSPDSLMLVTPLQALGSAEWVDDSGLALFLELARVLAVEKPAYTVRFALAATEAPKGGDLEGAGWRIPEDPLEARALIFDAGRSLVEELGRRGELERVRAVVILEPRARLRPRMARDLRSHPVFRTVFWAAAEALGETEAFPSEAGWSSPRGFHDAFQAYGLGQVVSLVDETTARAELQAEVMNARRARGEGGSRRKSPVDSNGLDAIGRVTLEGVTRLMRRFEKVDAFAP